MVLCHNYKTIKSFADCIEVSYEVSEPQIVSLRPGGSVLYARNLFMV